ncbi:MAG: hypothetical protein ABID64_02815 [Nitrospirota bacterium]
MTNNRIAQPGGNPPETRKERLATTLYKKCLSSATKLTYRDREALEEMSSDVLIQALFKDLKDVAYAEEDFIGRYYQIISDYLEEQLRNTHTEDERERFQFLRVVKTYLLPKLETLARGAREKGTQRNEATLESIIAKWTDQFGKYESLTTDPKIPIVDVALGSTRTSLGLPVISPKLPAQPAKPVEQYNKPGTVFGMPAYDPPTTPSKTKAHEPVRTSSGAEISLEQVGFGKPAPFPQRQKPATEPGIPAKESTAILPVLNALRNATKVEELIASTITDLPPKHDPSILRQQKDFEMYNNPNYTILSILKASNEQSKDEWEITRRNLQEAMALSFKNLKAEIARSINFDEILQQKALECIRNAFEKVGDPQCRKRVIHEFHALVKSIKNPNKCKIIMQIFESALSNRPEFEQPIKPSERMQKVYKQSGIKAPKMASPSAFTQTQETLNEAELAEMPENIRKSLRRLFTLSQTLGLDNMPMSGTVSQSIASMKDQDFEMMCHQTLNLLKIVDEKTGGITNPKTWIGQGRKTRKFIAKLKAVIPAQLAIMEQLLDSKGDLFIPPEILSRYS